MADATLQQFVKEALSAGATRSDVEQALLEAGWPRHQIGNALSLYSEVPFRVPVPVPKTQISARDAFLYLVMFGMLYLSAYNLGSLLFQFINIAIPDPAFPQARLVAESRIRLAISTLVVAFPVFLLIASIITKQIRKEPAQRSSAVRKWLTFLTLALASCIIVGDLIFLLNSLLSGELTLRVALKVLVVGGISGAIFYYYLNEIRADDRSLSQ